MQAQPDQWRQQKDASEGQSIGHRQERGQAQEHLAPDDVPLRNVIPVSPLPVELESAPWPCCFNANTLPQYDGDYDPKEFLMKFEAVVESNGGDATTKAKALVLALKGEVQYWYANIPKGYIASWFHLWNKLLSSFKGMQVEELDSNDLVNMCVQGGQRVTARVHAQGCQADSARARGVRKQHHRRHRWGLEGWKLPRCA
jgi:hypothetical protein